MQANHFQSICLFRTEGFLIGEMFTREEKTKNRKSEGKGNQTHSPSLGQNPKKEGHGQKLPGCDEISFTRR